MSERNGRVVTARRAMGVVVLALAATVAGAPTSGARSVERTASGAPAASSAPGDPVDLSGTVMGTGSLGGAASCGLDLSVSNTATITLAAGGEAGLQADYCVTTFDPNVVAAPIFGGTFTITTATGTATGTVSGSSETANATPGGFPLHLVLASTGGTGDLVGATGTLTFDGSAGPAASTINGSTTGSFTPHASTTTASVATTPTSVPARRTRSATVADGTATPATPVSGTASFTG